MSSEPGHNEANGVHPGGSSASDSIRTPSACPVCGKKFDRPNQVRGHLSGKHSNKPRLVSPSINLEALQPFQIGYIAGFLDGEGGIQITRTARKERVYPIALHPCVYFTNTNREAIEAIKKWLNTGNTVVSHSKKGYRDTYILHVTGIKNIRIVLKCLLPHLIIKRRQAELLLEYCQSRIEHYWGTNRQYSQAELELYSSLIQANKKGGKVTRQLTEV